MELSIEVWNKIKEVDNTPLNQESIDRFLESVKKCEGRFEVHELS